MSEQIVPYAETMHLRLPDFAPTDAYCIALTHPAGYRAGIENLSLMAMHWLDDLTGPEGCTVFPVGDLDENCKVDLADLAWLSRYWRAD